MNDFNRADIRSQVDDGTDVPSSFDEIRGRRSIVEGLHPNAEMDPMSMLRHGQKLSDNLKAAFPNGEVQLANPDESLSVLLIDNKPCEFGANVTTAETWDAATWEGAGAQFEKNLPGIKAQMLLDKVKGEGIDLEATKPQGYKIFTMEGVRYAIQLPGNRLLVTAVTGLEVI